MSLVILSTVINERNVKIKASYEILRDENNIQVVPVAAVSILHVTFTKLLPYHQNVNLYLAVYETSTRHVVMKI